jgi:hypothetical protein
MGGLRSTILLLVVLGGLAGYIYFVDANRDPTAADAKPKAFVELSAEGIEEIQIRNDSGETSRLQRVSENWQLVEPDAADADAGVVGTVTSNLASLEVQRVVDENPADLAQYGLNPARIDVAFRLADQQDFEHLLVGDTTPTGGDLFAKRPDETRVFLISSFLDSIFNKTPFDLRDKAVLTFERDTADGIEIEGGSTHIQFAKSGSDWRIVTPIAARADYAAVEGLMTRLSSTQMQQIVAPEAGDPGAHGLDRPSMTMTVVSGGSRATLLIGRADEGGRFAKNADRPEIFTVEESLLTDLAKDVPEYRRKDMFDARSFTADRIEARRADETLVFERSVGDGEETWRNAAGQDVDAAQVEDLMTKLSNLRAQAFEETAHAALEMPALTVIVGFEGDRTETVTFGRSAIDVFAGRSDEPGSARVDAMMFDEVVKAVDALK